MSQRMTMPGAQVHDQTEDEQEAKPKGISEQPSMSATAPMADCKDGVCQFYILKKKRHCRLLPLRNKTYCAEHACLYEKNNVETNDENDNQKTKRIPCPYDATHSVFQYRLEYHKKVCNARPVVMPPFYEKDVNSFGQDSFPEVKIEGVNNDSRTIAARLMEIQVDYDQRDRPASVMLDAIGSSDIGHEARRHLVQIANLLAIMEDLNLITKENALVDFGAGKGGVSYWLGMNYIKLVPDEQAKLIVVDRDSHRHKRDNKLTNEEKISVTRIRIDIKDLVLDLVPDLLDKKVAAISKHLCGEATDFTLSALIKSNKTSGFVIATCCHHRCKWDSFVGKEYFRMLGFTKEDFELILRISSWAICGCGKRALKEGDANVDEGRRSMGLQAKRILDMSRAEYVKTCGFQCKLMRFVSQENTLENFAIVGKKCGSDL